MKGERQDRHPRRFSAEGDFVRRLEGQERLDAIPPERVVGMMDVSASHTAVDLGAGIGYFSFPMARKASLVFSVDIEPKMLSLLSERAKARKVRNIVPIRGEITAVPLPDRSADRVLAAFVYHEVDRPRQLLLEARRLLKEGGRLTVVDFQRRETAFGPPVEERVTPEEVVSASKGLLRPGARFETDTYYQLSFEK